MTEHKAYKRRNDYTVIVFQNGYKTLKYRYVHSLRKFAGMLDNRFPNWKYINVYERRTGVYITRFYKGDSLIPDFVRGKYFND